MNGFQSALRILFCVALLLWPIVSFGQQAQQAEDITSDWEAFASFAETVLDSDPTDVKELDQIRSRIVNYREAFGAAQFVGGGRISTLESRIEALGPEPEEGQSEPEDVAEFRDRLQTQLNQLRAPQLLALQSFAHANGLIEEIDVTIRQLEAEQLLVRGASPLNPANWIDTLQDTIASLRAAWSDLFSGISAAVTEPGFSNKIPLVTAACLFGLVFWLFRFRWSKAICEPLKGRGASKTMIWKLLLTTLEVGFPIAGTYLFFYGLIWSGIFGTFSGGIAESIPKWVAIVLFSRWLITSLLAKEFRSQSIQIPEDIQRRFAFYVALIAYAFVLSDVGALFDELSPVRESSQLLFQSIGVFVASGVLGLIYVTGARHVTLAEGVELTKTQNTIAKALRIATPIFVIGCPLLAAIGYIPAAKQLLFPFIMTLIVVATIFILQQVIEELIGWLAKSEKSGKGSLAADLAAFTLYVLSVPVLAVAWGVRPAALREVWERFLQGVTIGETRISPEAILTFLVIFFIGYAIVKAVQSLLRDRILPKTNVSVGAQNALTLGAGYFGYFFAFLVAVSGAGISLSSLAIVAGALSVGIGFGLQTLVANFVSGIFLLLSRPISKGDWVEIGGKMGYVRDISVRSTTIETFDRTDLIVPNQDLIAGTVINYTKSSNAGRVILSVGVAYGTDTKMVERILLEIAEAHPMVLSSPKPVVILQALADSAIQFEIRAIIRDVSWIFNVRTELYHEVVRRFEEEGIVIPFTQQDVWLHNADEIPDDKKALLEKGQRQAHQTQSQE